MAQMGLLGTPKGGKNVDKTSISGKGGSTFEVQNRKKGGKHVARVHSGKIIEKVIFAKLS